MTNTEAIDTRIYGDPENIRAVAAQIYEVYEYIEGLSGQFRDKLRVTPTHGRVKRHRGTMTRP